MRDHPHPNPLPEGVGLLAVDFTLDDVDGRAVRLADLRGRVVVLCFWSAECPWVERADAQMRELLAQWGERVAYLPVASNANESPEQIRSAARARGIPAPVWDADGALAEQYGAQVTPHFFIIDGEGILRYQGAPDDVTFRRREASRHYVRSAVDALLAGRAPEVTESAAYGCTLVRFKGLVA